MAQGSNAAKAEIMSVVCALHYIITEALRRGWREACSELLFLWILLTRPLLAHAHAGRRLFLPPANTAAPD